MNYISKTLISLTKFVENMNTDNMNKVILELEELNIKMNEMNNELMLLRAKEAEEDLDDEDLQRYLNNDALEAAATEK